MAIALCHSTLPIDVAKQIHLFATGSKVAMCFYTKPPAAPGCTQREEVTRIFQEVWQCTCFSAGTGFFLNRADDVDFQTREWDRNNKWYLNVWMEYRRQMGVNVFDHGMTEEEHVLFFQMCMRRRQYHGLA